jgi:hypothetical protein
MCKELLVIPVYRVVDKKRIIRKNGGQRRRKGTRGRFPPPPPPPKNTNIKHSNNNIGPCLELPLRSNFEN